MSSDGNVMPPRFFKSNEKINKTVYLNVLENVIAPWMNEVACLLEVHLPFQQDSAPADQTKFVQDSLKANIPQFWDSQIWPSISPNSGTHRLGPPSPPT